MEKQYAIYSRKSRFTGRGESVENQIEMCRSYLALHFGQQAAEKAEFYEDEGFSGGNLDRPQFQKMMSDAEKCPFAAVVVYRLDRISRNIGDFAGLIERLGEKGIGFISIREQFDTASPMGRAMMYIASVFSQLERETIAERIRDNMQELAKTGRWLGGNTPLGYTSVREERADPDGRIRSFYRLQELPGEGALVRLIFDRFSETGSLSETDRFLLQKQYYTRRGREFTRYAVRGILTNPVYMQADREAFSYFRKAGAEISVSEAEFDGSRGIMAYNRTLQKPGRKNILRPVEEWIIAPGAHPGFISGNRWVQVQELLQRNCAKSFHPARSGEALLSGILTCALCHHYMRPKLTNRVNPDGVRIYTYRCTERDRSRGQSCSVSSVNGNLLDAWLTDILEKLEETPDILLNCLIQGRREFAEGKEWSDEKHITELLSRTEREIKICENSFFRYLNTEMESCMTEKLSELYRKREELQKELAEEKESGVILSAEEFCREDWMKGLFPEQKKQIVRRLVSKVLWDGKEGEMFFVRGGEDSK